MQDSLYLDVIIQSASKISLVIRGRVATDTRKSVSLKDNLFWGLRGCFFHVTGLCLEIRQTRNFERKSYVNRTALSTGATTAEKSPLPLECNSCKKVFFRLQQKLKAFMILAQSLRL